MVNAEVIAKSKELAGNMVGIGEDASLFTEVAEMNMGIVGASEGADAGQVVATINEAVKNLGILNSVDDSAEGVPFVFTADDIGKYAEGLEAVDGKHDKTNVGKVLFRALKEVLEKLNAPPPAEAAPAEAAPAEAPPAEEQPAA
eukprot:CAMPEP_0202890266 /NCGR_PEP_ID=MMETSP1392-20130828/736_1 /ASSEMBLY_ACC=CAM_ASM_000868 /TAXON_ID=225041 /ORGANISM="Chlamydomonas chlamydogama, Strain SAG 11-48b" /LENGTH=143 /DNA_ID=CAMNT_0049573803 /DNA_START=88 /DNA_END=519 /DNA_ORIENTATION=+